MLRLGDSVAHCKRVHAKIIVSGIGEDTFVYNLMLKILGGYEGGVGLGYARLVFDKMPDRNLVSWATLIYVYNGNGLSEYVLGLFVDCLRNVKEGVNEYILAGVLRGCAQFGGVVQGRQLHGFVEKFGLLQDVFVGNSLIGFRGVLKVIISSAEI